MDWSQAWEGNTVFTFHTVILSVRRSHQLFEHRMRKECTVVVVVVVVVAQSVSLESCVF